MEVFSSIDESVGIIRNKQGVEKQVTLYHRNTRVYIPYAGGFVEVRGEEMGGSSAYTTRHPDVKLIEYDCTKMARVKDVGLWFLRWTRGVKE